MDYPDHAIVIIQDVFMYGFATLLLGDTTSTAVAHCSEPRQLDAPHSHFFAAPAVVSP